MASSIYVYIYFACLWLFARPFVCPFVSNKRQKGWTDLIQFLCGTSHEKNVFKNVWFLLNFENARKFFIKSAKFFRYCFILYKEKMLRDRATSKSWNEREAQIPLKA